LLRLVLPLFWQHNKKSHCSGNEWKVKWCLNMHKMGWPNFDHIKPYLGCVFLRL
jgi:hypothetical protein